MSRVYFHSPSGDAELRGSERAHLGAIVNDVTVGFLSKAYHRDVEQLLSLVKPGHYLHKIDRRGPGWLPGWRDSFACALVTGMQNELFIWRGHVVEPFSVCLNTALRYGSDPVRLAARIHGQCEIHCYVEGPNRAWLADLIQQGLDDRILRKGLWYVDRVCDGPLVLQPDRKWSDQGWGDVIALLRACDDEPVVTSYSVCDQFPNREAAAWESPPMPEDWVPAWVDSDEERARWEREHPEHEDREEQYRECAGDAWYDLPKSEQWRLAMDGLRANQSGLEISPQEFGKYYFRHGLTLPDLLAPEYAQRLDEAFDLQPLAPADVDEASGLAPGELPSEHHPSGGQS